jgi:hypothetical protein
MAADYSDDPRAIAVLTIGSDVTADREFDN